VQNYVQLKGFKVIKAIGVIITTAFLSVTYVHQYASLMEQSYSMNRLDEDLGLLIDQNKSLRYNISALESPLRLDNKIQQKIETSAYVPLDSYAIKMERPVLVDSMIATKALSARVASLVLSMFALDNEAVAKEVGN
jgi:hypothetical protein